MALSGGLDSCVLDLILSWSPSCASHCNFQLRGITSDNDARWVEALSQEKVWNFMFKTLIPNSTHLIKKYLFRWQARDLRYQWFETAKQNDYNFIFVAHHADDGNLYDQCHARYWT